MDDFFSSASLFWSDSGKAGTGEKRTSQMRDLEKLLMSSPFLSEGEKAKMAKVIPLFSDAVLADMQETLIRQNLRFLQKKSAK